MRMIIVSKEWPFCLPTTPVTPNPLAHLMEAGITVFPAGRPDDAISSPTGLTKHWLAGCRVFQFVPGRHGMVVFNLTLGRFVFHSGRSTLFMWSVDFLQDYRKDDIDSHPPYTDHPNGFGLLFRYEGSKRFSRMQYRPGIQVILDGAAIAPGSVVGGHPVRMRGNVAKSPWFCEVL